MLCSALKWALAALALFGIVWTWPAAAEDDPAFLSLGVGWFDLVQQDEQAADFRLEYRGDKRAWIFKPWIGVNATSGGAFFGGGGVLVDLFFGRRFVLTPSFGPGGYIKGSGKDLGSTLIFRSQIEAAYRFDDRSRLAVAFSNLNNFGIAGDNPGAEILSLYYHLPFNKLF